MCDIFLYHLYFSFLSPFLKTVVGVSKASRPCISYLPSLLIQQTLNITQPNSIA